MRTSDMKALKLEEVFLSLLASAGRIQHGEAQLNLVIHGGTITKVKTSFTESELAVIERNI